MPGGIIQALRDTGTPPPPAPGVAQSLVGTTQGELKTSDIVTASNVREFFLTLINEVRALRKVVCDATGQPFLDPDFRE